MYSSYQLKPMTKQESENWTTKNYIHSLFLGSTTRFEHLQNLIADINAFSQNSEKWTKSKIANKYYQVLQIFNQDEQLIATSTLYYFL